MILSSIGLTALSLGSLALKFGGDDLSVVSDMVNLFISGPTSSKLDDVYKKIGKLREEIERPLNADLEKCSRDALLKSVFMLIEDTLDQPEGQDEAVKLFLKELVEKLRKEYRRIAALSENDEQLLLNPASSLHNTITLLVENKVDEAQRRERLQRELAEYVLDSIGGLREQRHLSRQHAAYHLLAERLREGWKNKAGQPTNFLSVYTLCLRDNLKSDEPPYCKRAREILKLKQLAEISWEQQEIKLHLTEVLDRTEVLSRQNDTLQALLNEFKKYWLSLRQQPYLPIETEWASNKTHLLPQAEQQRGQLLINYRYRQVPFVGRQDAKQALNGFLHTDVNYPFLWWAVVGSGGSGKSRLAYETCYSQFQEHGWQAGFIRQAELLTSYDWSNWQPLAPTLLVIDYVTQHVDALQKAMNRLHDRQATLDHPVRWLLVERYAQSDDATNGLSTQQNWWQTLTGDPNIGLQLYQTEPLRLSPFSSVDQWAIICAVLTAWQKPMPNQDETLKALQQIDPQSRPLFAIMAALALATTGSIRNWTSKELFDLVNRELQKFWESQSANGHVSDALMNLQALVTLCYGLTAENIEELYSTSRDWLPSIEQLDEQRPLIETLLPPYPNEVLQLHPLQPDIIGEYVILERLKELNKKDYSGKNQRTRRALVELAWQLDPMYAALVTYRIFDDHSQRHEKDALLAISQKDTDLKCSYWWAALTVDLINWHSNNAGQLEQAAGVYADLKALADRWSEDAQVALRQASGAFSLLTNYGNAGQLEQAAGMYADLKALADRWSEDAQISLEQAKGAFSLLTNYGNAGQLEQAAGVYADLKALADRWSEDAQVALAFSLLTNYGNAGQLEQAAGVYADLKALADRWSEDAQVALRQAKGAFNQIIFILRNQEQESWGQVVEYARHIFELADRFPDDQEIREIAYKVVQILGLDKQEE